MGIEPFLVASSLIGVVAQRLVRTLCPRCKRPFTPNVEQAEVMGLSPENVAGTTLYEPGECDVCRRGYFGRAGIFEMLVVDDEVQRQVLEKVSSTRIRQRADGEGNADAVV